MLLTGLVEREQQSRHGQWQPVCLRVRVVQLSQLSGLVRSLTAHPVEDQTVANVPRCVVQLGARTASIGLTGWRLADMTQRQWDPCQPLLLV